jgi:hypothetical protein
VAASRPSGGGSRKPAAKKSPVTSRVIKGTGGVKPKKSLYPELPGQKGYSLAKQEQAYVKALAKWQYDALRDKVGRKPQFSDFAAGKLPRRSSGGR